MKDYQTPKYIRLIRDNPEAKEQHDIVQNLLNARTITKPIFIDVCGGSHPAGELLSRYEFLWGYFGYKPFFYPDPNLVTELKYSRDTIINARKLLVEKKFLSKYRKGVPPKNYYTYQSDQVEEAVYRYYCSVVENNEFDFQKSSSPTFDGRSNQLLMVGQSDHPIRKSNKKESKGEGERTVTQLLPSSNNGHTKQIKTPESTLTKGSKKKEISQVAHHGREYVQLGETNGKSENVNKWNSVHFLDYFGAKYLQRYKKKEWTLIQQKGITRSKMKRIMDEFVGELNKNDLLELIDYFFSISIKATKRTWDLNYFIKQHSTMLNEMINLRDDITSEDGLPSRIPSTAVEEQEIQKAIGKKLERTTK